MAAGMGVSLLPEMALSEFNKLQPAKIRITEPHVTRTVGIIRRKGEGLPLVAEVFQRFVMQYFHLE
ncbi:HTH-type transcriptional regulator GltC [compost metagenome]